MNPEIVSFQYATNMCVLLENVGGSEQNRSVIANVQSDDLWPSCMHAAVLSTGQWRRRRHSAGCSPMCQWGASSSRWCRGRVSCTHVLASNTRSGSRPGLDPDC